jgi:hypothetical protein
MANIENSSRNTASPETRAAPTEEVVDEFAEIVENHRGNLRDDNQRREAFTELHGVLDKFENHAVKLMYDEGRMPTFESIDRVAQSAARALAADNEPEAQRIAKLLQHHVTSVKRWCRQYVASLLRFRASKTAFLRMNDEERRDALGKADADRRRIHDALLGSLASLEDLLREGSEYTDIGQPIRWNEKDQLQQGAANSTPLMFSTKTLEDRDVIRDWAIVADRIEEIHKITGHTEPAGK